MDLGNDDGKESVHDEKRITLKPDIAICKRMVINHEQADDERAEIKWRKYKTEL